MIYTKKHHGPIDGGPGTEEQTLLQKCEDASKKEWYRKCNFGTEESRYNASANKGITPVMIYVSSLYLLFLLILTVSKFGIKFSNMWNFW